MIARIKNFFYKEEHIEIENILDDPNSILGAFLSRFISVLVIFFALVVIFESLGSNATIYKSPLFIFDAFVSTVFGIEYFYRLYKTKFKIDFIFSPIRIIDLLSFLPFFLGFVAGGSFLKLLRILRILRVLRLLKKIPLTAGFLKALRDYKDEYFAVFILFGTLLFIGSSFVFYAERDVLNTAFTSIPMALWWGLVTMTTVGFGDMYPQTDLGRIIGSFLVFLGPLVIGLFSAVTVMVFQETSKHQESGQMHIRGKHCRRCKTTNPRDANYCMKCGEEI